MLKDGEQMKDRKKRILVLRMCELASFLCCVFVGISAVQGRLIWTVFFITMTYTNYRNAVNLQIAHAKGRDK